MLMRPYQDIPSMKHQISGDSSKKVRRRSVGHVNNMYGGMATLAAGFVIAFMWVQHAVLRSETISVRGTPIAEGGTERWKGDKWNTHNDGSELLNLLARAETLEAELLRKRNQLGLSFDVKLDDGITGVALGSTLRDLLGAASTPVKRHINGEYQGVTSTNEYQVEEHASPTGRSTPGSLALTKEEGDNVPFGLPGEPMFGPTQARRVISNDPAIIRHPVPLVVGGTDGSGTRGVVALLQRLGVPMVIEDGGTLDVHGAPYMAKEGWPELVQPILEWSHGSNYETSDASMTLRSTTLMAVDRLFTKMKKSAQKVHTLPEKTASYVSWGLKAPVSMILVPFFTEAWGNEGFKFLHVVRDGRDLAFSGNQTPVEKFFDTTFSNQGKDLEAPLKAIRLWNKWNTGLYEWAKQKQVHGTGLDYLLLHTEDLLDPEHNFAAVKDVAEFVGSPLSDKDLCCIALEKTRDMGSHSKTKEERAVGVTSRFGKWKVRGRLEVGVDGKT
ncbi:unnamed protein product [Choristocarpus tenellus]